MTQLHVSAAMFDAALTTSYMSTASEGDYWNSGRPSQGDGRLDDAHDNQEFSGGIREYEEPRDSDGVIVGCFTDDPVLKNWMDTWNREAEQEKLNASEVLEYDEVGKVVICTIKDKAGRVSSLVTIAPANHSWHSFEKSLATEKEGRIFHKRIVAAIQNGKSPESVIGPSRH